MKKAIGMLALLIMILFSLHAETQAATTSQTIAGFINHIGSDYMLLEVSYDYSHTDQQYHGINLDINDSGNPNRYLIAPSASHELGLRIGSFNLETTNRDYTLRIYHQPLILVNSNPAVTIDYELSIQYAISGGNPLSAYCLSATDMANPDKKINVSLNSPGGVIIIQNAGFFFRLKDASQVRTAGQYESIIYIQVGTE